MAAIIEKLLSNWKDFKNYLKHKCKEMKLEDLIVRLRIEEDNRVSEKKIGNHSMESKAHVLKRDIKPIRKGSMLANKGPRVVIPRGSKAIALCATNRDIVQRIVETVKHK